MSSLEIKEHMVIGVVGVGFVGKATALFKSEKIDVLLYDLDED